ncbi:caspase family protein [Lacihabitans soyangensis]|nr:caspase family protein [Lacihabitans soyangensis]
MKYQTFEAKSPLKHKADKFFLFFKKLTFLLFIFFISGKTFAQSTSYFDKNTWVFMVGVLEWSDKNEFASFDKRGRVDAKILKFFQDNGIAADHIVYLKDKEATTSEVKKTFASFLKKAKKEDKLFFYYCGHGYHNDKNNVCFANYSGGDWTANEIIKAVDLNFAGKTAFFVADCCNSGGLADEAQKYKTKNFVALNSVVPKDLSTGNWTFSNALLYGLQGKNFVDTDSNGSLTLTELAQYIDQEMAIVEGQKAAYYVPQNLKNLVITNGIPKRKDKKIGDHVWVDYDGEDYLGFVTATDPTKGLNVRFYSYTNNELEWVAANRTKPFKCQSDFSVGALVSVYSTYDEKWMKARVLKKFSCLHYVRYEGYGSEWDEWVSPDKIKK